MDIGSREAAAAGLKARFAEIRAGVAETVPALPKMVRAAELASRLAAEASADSEIRPERVAVVGTLTTTFLAKAIGCALVQEGVVPALYDGQYGAFLQEGLDPHSPLAAFRPDLVVVAPDLRALAVALPIGAPADEVAQALEARCAVFAPFWDALTGRLGAKVIQHRLVPPVVAFTGMAEHRAPASLENQARFLNDRLAELAGARVTWIEIDRLAAEVGLRNWFAERHYFTARQPFDPKFLPDYLPFFRGAWRSARARAKKVLVLDLDNTLWGGVIGDDGVEGIKLGPGSPAGEAFAAFAHYVQGLRARGVILAVCSKNDPDIAAAGFSHPHMPLRVADFAAFVCSWQDKVSGLRQIAKDLNVGIDSLVFADDNPAECALIRRELPEVSVVDLGTDPSSFVRLFEAGCWFAAQAYTAEDYGRAAAYAARREAHAAMSSATDLEGYLRDLAMVGRLSVPEEGDIARLAQMEQKTNQFNLTTRRFSEAEIRARLADPNCFVLALRLADRFGNHGLVSSLYARREGEAVRIEGWLMSCRVFGRTAEAFMLAHLARLAVSRGARRLVGTFSPTEKNGVVADLYARLGFAPAGEGIWTRDLSAGLEDLSSAIADEDAGVVPAATGAAS